MGFLRNLTAGEIVDQVVAVVKDMQEEKGVNIVFMGMGEALQNFSNLIIALEILQDADGLRIGPRRITVSTAGHVPLIKKLADHPIQVRLAITLKPFF